MESIGTEVGQKMRSAIKAKLMELGCYVDDELPDYIMVMVANKRSRSQMEDDLQLFLRNDTQIFVEWLQQVLKKLKEVTITNPEVCGTFRELKRKAAMEIAECVIKKEKRDKKLKPEKKTRSVEIIPEVKSITDEIPVQATKLVEKMNQNVQRIVEEVNESNFDIPSLAEVNELEDSQLDIVANKIREARNRIVLMKSDSEDEDFINLRADAEELMGDDLDKSITKTIEENKITVVKKPLSERLGAKPTTNSARKIASNKIKSSVQSIVKKPEGKIRKKESVHKRLGLPSSVISLPKKDESDEELPKSVRSSVKVKPRRNISGLVQANKNLLLKAVAEAQKSVTQTPIVGREIKKKKILTNKINNNVNKNSDEKVQNIIIEIKSTKIQSETEESDQEGTDAPSTLDITYEDDLKEFEADFDAESEKQQFIVTLDGLKDKNILLEPPKSVRRAPSPIIFDKNDSPKAEKTKLPPLALKTKERCKYWPNCRLREVCEYVHPNTPCKMFPMCKFGDKCLYIHPKCKFDASCTRKDCPYSHGNTKISVQKVVRAVVSPEVCKFHPNCSNPHCHFYHPIKPCKFGKYCINKAECNFSHDQIPNKDKLKWHSNAR